MPANFDGSVHELIWIVEGLVNPVDPVELVHELREALELIIARECGLPAPDCSG
jgi:hypothetical protein